MQIKDKPEIVCNDPKKKTKNVASTPTAHLSCNPLPPALLYLPLYFILSRPHDVALSLDEAGGGEKKNVNVNQDNIITAPKRIERASERDMQQNSLQRGGTCRRSSFSIQPSLSPPLSSPRLGHCRRHHKTFLWHAVKRQSQSQTRSQLVIFIADNVKSIQSTVRSPSPLLGVGGCNCCLLCSLQLQARTPPLHTTPPSLLDDKLSASNWLLTVFVISKKTFQFFLNEFLSRLLLLRLLFALHNTLWEFHLSAKLISVVGAGVGELSLTRIRRHRSNC